MSGMRRRRSAGGVGGSGNARVSDLEEAVSTWPFLEDHGGLMMRAYSCRERRVVVSCRSTAEHLAAHSWIGMVHMLGLRREDDNSVLEERVGEAVHLRDCTVAGVSCHRDRLADIFGLSFGAPVGRSCRLNRYRSGDHVDVRRPCCFCRCCLHDCLYVDACVVFRVPCRSPCQSVCRQPYRSLRFQVPFQARRR